MAEDMVLAIAQPPAFRAVPEFHLRVGDVRNAARCAPVERVPPADRMLLRLEHHFPIARLHPPEDVPAEEQEKVADRSEYEKARGPRPHEQLVGVANPREKRKPLDPDREDKKNIELKIREQPGKGQEYGPADKDVCRS